MISTRESSPNPPIAVLPDLRSQPEGINFSRTLAVKGFGGLKIRPIQLDDEEEMIRFHQRISKESIYMRYFEFLG